MDAIFSVVVSLFGALVGYFGNRMVSNMGKGRDREYVIKTDSGKKSEIVVEANSGSTITSIIQENQELENTVHEHLARYLNSLGNARLRPGRFSDFVAEIGDERFAVEIKGGNQKLTVQMINKYLDMEPQISRMVLFTGDTTNVEQSDIMDHLEQTGKLKVVRWGELGSVDFRSIGKALEPSSGT